MVDVVDSATRSRMMAGIRGRDTRPEVALRRALHARGLRFRLHRKGLPGRPDIVFPGRRAAVFVHGCFWHRHPGCRFALRCRQRGGIAHKGCRVMAGLTHSELHPARPWVGSALPCPESRRWIVPPR